MKNRNHPIIAPARGIDMIGSLRMRRTAQTFYLIQVTEENKKRIEEECRRAHLEPMTIEGGPYYIVQYYEDDMDDYIGYASLEEIAEQYEAIGISPDDGTAPHICASCAARDSLGICSVIDKDTEDNETCEHWAPYNPRRKEGGAQ